ncbi:IclR family transcriptional regulator C-terminal domain-containing protein [Streptomyces sp. NPDC091280]|uniref:IclR family transcriptional regulator domain-containing protein n=1 Tax=Streptomyces sp. NPDC091280 TaxID=3365984 RepID=UPI003826D37A
MTCRRPRTFPTRRSRGAQSGVGSVTGNGLQAFTDRTIVDRDRLTEELRRVRTQENALTDGESAHGVRSLAVPILDTSPRHASLFPPNTRLIWSTSRGHASVMEDMCPRPDSPDPVRRSAVVVLSPWGRPTWLTSRSRTGGAFH